MLKTMNTRLLFSRFVELYILGILFKVVDCSHSSKLGITRTEFTLPRVIQDDGTVVPFEMPYRPLNIYLGSSNITSPETLLVIIEWRNSALTLDLHKTELVSPDATLEWQEGNFTFVSKVHEDCFYHGYVTEVEDSFVGLSSCFGLSGFIHIGDEELTLEPAKGAKVKNLHKLYSTANRGKRKQTLKHGRRVRRSTTFRRKRDTSETKYLEVMLAADSTVVDFHGKDKYEEYLLGMLNIMNLAYQHDTLGVDIRVVLVRMKVMDDYTSDPMVSSRNNHIAHTLQRFCDWATRLLNRHNPRDPNNHDIAIYVTKKEIGPAGYAPVTGLCYPRRSCAIIKDEGLSSGFVMAHESAHTFGLLHDGQGNSCHGPAYHGSIMAPLMESSFNRYFWTECSRIQMKARLPRLTCLNGKPAEHVWKQLPDPLGNAWTMDEQCRQEFGEHFSLCDAYYHRDQCPVLWCSERRRPMLCKTKGGPPLEGTKCGGQKFCVSGRCQFKDDVLPADGSWSPWGDWGACSTPCGLGLKFRHRRCDNPRPAFGGKNCEGSFEQYRTCNFEFPCLRPRDLRADMCSNFNYGQPEDKHQNWMPYQTENGVCKIACISEETGEKLITDGDVIDGVACLYEDPGGICVRGRCQRIGCDGKIRSSKSHDACGVCGGDSSSCRMVQDTYITPSKKEYGKYEQITTLPTGARGIEISEYISTADNLIVKDRRDDKIYVNKKSRQDSSKQFVVNGARFVYTRRGYEETIKSMGPLNNEFDILLYVTDTYRQTGVNYKYIIPKDMQPSSDKEDNQTREKSEEKEDEDKKDRTGENRTDDVDSDDEDDDNTHEESAGSGSDEGDNVVTQPPSAITKDVAWVFAKWTECSKTCGGGIYRTTYACNDFDLEEIVHDSECAHREMPKVDEVACNKKPCSTTRWELGPWQDCSVPCGYGGEEKRELICLREFDDGTEEEINHSDCGDDPLSNLTRKCEALIPCVGHWVTSEWSACSSTCGPGVQVRHTFCDYVDEEEYYSCDGVPPANSKTCQLRPCPSKQDLKCMGDKSGFCRLSATARTCKLRGYRLICCESCKKYNTRRRRRRAIV